ncbi:MAG TPA: ATP-binding protein [Candidatus Kapabacteria bacterium]|nr:ATP-binding protein [Candidatus Kapabacteria bacterium]HPO62402.1 ATP-binding protein [Candidatus Kapabacteria bacterium]
MEKLIIQNFGGIKEFTFEIKKINILIGPQATGKSIVAKLLYFFKQFDIEFIKAVLNDDYNIEQFNEIFIKIFITYFSPFVNSTINFKIKYELKKVFIEIEYLNNKLSITYSDFYVNEFHKLKEIFKRTKQPNEFDETRDLNKLSSIIINIYEKSLIEYNEINLKNIQMFIPSGRAFISTLQSNFFSLQNFQKNLSRNLTIDPFLVEFGAYYEGLKSINSFRFKRYENDDLENIIQNILHSKYEYKNNIEYFIYKDGREIPIFFASSGQQETLPLVLTLKELYYNIPKDGGIIFIEEPEAHIYPSAQKSIVELIAMVFNFSNSRYQFVITTHSPYILTSFNNLIQAGDIRTKMEEEDLSKLYDIIEKDIILSPDVFSAYNMDYDSIEDLIDPETKLISAEKLDSVSTDIAIQFERLLDLI